MLYTVNDTDIDKCFVFILSFPRNLCPFWLKGFSVLSFYCVFFFPSTKNSTPFSLSQLFLLGLEFAFRCIKILVRGFFWISFLSFSIVSLASLISLLDIRTVHRWMWGSALCVISLCTEEIILLGEARQPGSSASLGVSS